MEESFLQDPIGYTDKFLLYYFGLMHDMYDRKREGHKVMLADHIWSIEDITDYYVLILREMRKREMDRYRTSELDEDAAPLFADFFLKRNGQGPILHKARHRHDQCMQCKEAPTYEVLWAEGMGHAWFCTEHLTQWAFHGDGKGDVCYCKGVVDGVAATRFSDNKNPNVWEKLKRELNKFFIEKQEDIFLNVPDEEGSYRYSWQHHYLGSGAHADLRFESGEGDSLIGWTVADLVQGAIQEPVETVDAAKRWDRAKEAWKINYRTGKFKERKNSDGEDVRLQLRSFPKGMHPKEWLRAQGVTPPFPAPGSTKEHRGVFTVLDGSSARKDARIEYGAQKRDTHEYFITGGLMKGRLIIKRLAREDSRKSWISNNMEDLCKNCGQCCHFVEKGEPTVIPCPNLVKNEDGTTRCGIYKDRMYAMVSSKGLVGMCKSRQDHEFDFEGCLYNTGDKPLVRNHELIKQHAVLPAGVETDEQSSDSFWVAEQPINQTPLVLSIEEVNKKWMPPLGKSALPKAVRDSLPPEFHYWKLKTEEGARNTRDALVEAIKTGEVELEL